MMRRRVALSLILAAGAALATAARRPSHPQGPSHRRRRRRRADVSSSARSSSREPAASIVVFPQASEWQTPGRGRRDVEETGATNVRWVRSPTPRGEAGVESAAFIWFPGGDQARLMKRSSGPGARVIARRYRDGAIVGGTSAGRR